MKYQRISPAPSLQNFVECFWLAESKNVAVVTQKIIPDGFPEIIFHFGDPYRIKLNDSWELQDKGLVAGQIKNHFLLENTGGTDVFGIKLKPAALRQLYGVKMAEFTGKVISLSNLQIPALDDLEVNIRKAVDIKEKVSIAETHVKRLIAEEHELSTINKAIKLIFAENGKGSISDLCKQLFITERQLQRLFQEYIGLSPKFYSRIIRFNFIFQLLQEKNSSWTDITYHSGYFDQSHFIRDFKAFSGEDPSKYFFDENNMANFFLKKA